MATVAAVVGAIAALFTVIIGQGGIVGLLKGYSEKNSTSKTTENPLNQVNVKNNNNSQATSQGNQSNISIEEKGESDINESSPSYKLSTPQVSPTFSINKALLGRWKFLGFERGKIESVLGEILGIEFFEGGDCLWYIQLNVFQRSVKTGGTKYEFLSPDQIKIYGSEDGDYKIYSVSLSENILKLEDAAQVFVFQRSETIELNSDKFSEGLEKLREEQRKKVEEREKAIERRRQLDVRDLTVN